MNQRFVQALPLVALGFLLSVTLGYWLAAGNYLNLILFAYVIVGAVLFFSPGYAPLLAFGIVSPITIPLPGITAFPVLLLVLGLCLAKYMYRRLMLHQKEKAPSISFPLPVLLFFGWVALQYLRNPALPNLAGFGTDVTGFRSYLNYGISLLLFMTLGWFAPDHSQQRKLLRWIAGLAMVLVLMLLPFTLFGDWGIGRVLNAFGLFVTEFDTGMIRIVAFGGLGLLLVAFGTLPQLIGLNRRQGAFLIALGLIGVVVGGSRGAVLGTMIILFTVFALRGMFQALALAALGAALLLAASWFVGESGALRSAGVLRFMSLISPRVAHMTDAASNIAWRKERWERAMVDIRQSPLLGRGYGGLSAAFSHSHQGSMFEMQSVEIDVASGNIHNGLLSGARALGIPGIVLFTAAFLSIFGKACLRAWHTRKSHSFESHALTFFAAMLASSALSIMVGYDINSPLIWFNLGMCVLVQATAARRATNPSEPAMESSPVGESRPAPEPRLMPGFVRS